MSVRTNMIAALAVALLVAGCSGGPTMGPTAADPATSSGLTSASSAPALKTPAAPAVKASNATCADWVTADGQPDAKLTAELVDPTRHPQGRPLEPIIALAASMCATAPDEVAWATLIEAGVLPDNVPVAPVDKGIDYHMADPDQWCTTLLAKVKYTDFQTAHGLSTATDTPTADFGDGPYGSGVLCEPDALLVTRSETASEDDAAALLAALGKLDDAFAATMPPSLANLNGVRGQFTYASDATGTSASLDAGTGTRVVSITYLGPGQHISEADARDLLGRVAVIGLGLGFPTGLGD